MSEQREFAIGQYVELIVTLSPVDQGRAIVRRHGDDGRYLIEMLHSETPSGETVWASADDLIAA